jgi:hypothetical protein
MRRRVLALALLASLAGAACGSVAGSRAASPSPTPRTEIAAVPSGALRLVFVVRPAADPQAVGRRIAGPGANVMAAYSDRRPRDDLPIAIVVRSYAIPVSPDQAQAMLGRAQADPGVEWAYLDGQPECVAHDPAC